MKIEDVINRVPGGVKEVSEKMNVSLTAVSHWIKDDQIPFKRLTEFERVTGIDRHELHPELFKGYSKNTQNQYQLTINESFMLIANEVIKKSNQDKVNKQRYKDAMLNLKDVANTLCFDSITCSSVSLWAEMISNAEIQLSPIDLNLMIERGGIDPFVINRTFNQESNVN